jgi:predicted 2-oxoglutarate/Fe(II)-dependent dioxygenase YbiX
METYIKIPNFIEREECKLLVRAFNESVPTNTANRFFDDMIVYPSAIQDPTTRGLMGVAQRRILDCILAVFDVAGPLYPDSVMLCRWGPGKQMASHVDNQVSGGIGTPWRTHSAIVYLNDDFIGGELVFTKLDEAILPRQGMLVAFPAGPKFEHGVGVVRRGDRYTMPSWYTNDVSRRFAID